MAKNDIKEKKENPFGGLQLWKVVGIFALVFTAVQLATAAIDVGSILIMDQINVGDNLRIFVGRTISHIGMIAAILIITIPVIKSVLKHPGLDTTYPRKNIMWCNLFVGIGITSTAMLAIFLIELILGYISISGFALTENPVDAWLRAIWLALLVNSVTAVGEETLYRGLLLQGIEITWDKWGALLISSIIFGGSHILIAGANQANWLKFIPLLALPGVVMGWAYLRTGNLWLSTGVHFAWNLFQNDIFNLTGSHSDDTLFGLVTEVSGPRWFVGATYGIEVGAAGIICLLLITAGIWWWTKKNDVPVQKD